MIHVLLYGDIDLNLIDGSSIWLASLSEVIAGEPDISVTVLQKTRLTRDVVIRNALTSPRVRFIDPWELGEGNFAVKSILSQSPGGKLSPEIAAALITYLHEHHSFSLLIVRGMATARLLVQIPQIASRMWVYVTNPERCGEDSSSLKRIADHCCKVVCQTEEAKSILARHVAPQDPARIIVLPPMIPALTGRTRREPDSTAPRLGYTGKLSPPYMILEMLDAFERIRVKAPGAEFHVVGDKFHNVPPVDGFVEMARKRLESTPGVVWHGGVSRREVTEILQHVDIASSWRAVDFENTVELSTKILEYSALGIPVLMNPTPVEKRIFGVDYPAYVNSHTDFVGRFLELSSSPSLYASVSQSVQATAAEFTFDSIRKRIRPLLNASIAPTRGQDSHLRLVTVESHHSRSLRPLRVVFAGHDLKFTRNLVAHFSQNPGYEVRIDQWRGHDGRDERHSEDMLSWADIIFCEWCLGNAVWYSKRKRPSQRLLVRLHHQEMALRYRLDVAWDNVASLVFTNFTHFNTFRREQPAHADRAVVVFCDVDCKDLAKDKLPWAEFNIGMVGINPMRKRPDLALEILAKLRAVDSRYTLFFKTRMPWEYSWLWNRPSEREYFSELLAQIDRGPLRNSVVFDAHGDDMALWYSRVGYLVSTSDHEGSHQAVAEGMASGCIPIIRNWDGATPLYPSRFVFTSVNDAVELIRSFSAADRYRDVAAAAGAYAERHFGTPQIVRQLDRLFRGHDLPCPNSSARQLGGERPQPDHSPLSALAAPGTPCQQ